MARQPKNREQLAAGFFKMYMAGQQWKMKLAAGEITENELWEKAYALADNRIEKRMNILQTEFKNYTDWAQSDQLYLEEREEQYREDYDWTVKSDEKILENILTTEVNLRRLERDLQDNSLSGKERGDRLKTMMDLLKVHKDLLTAAGIDRLSREKKKHGADPIEDWERIKELAHVKMDTLKDEFVAKAAEVSSEAELRDRMKFHLGYPFAVIDAALIAHRRVLGLSQTVEES